MVNPRLTPTKKKAKAKTATKVIEPKVSVTSPVDTAPIAAVLSALSDDIRKLGIAQARILQAIESQTKVLEDLTKNRPEITVAAPVVKMPARPRSYQVSYEDENGDTNYMSIQANSPN